MKLVGIVGSIADQSYNRMLMEYIVKSYKNIADIEMLDISEVPLFNKDDDQTNTPAVQTLNRKILQADGVIIATPEHNHAVPAPLKSIIEWLSYNIHPLDSKPVMIVGASYYNQGTSRAQLQLRQILEAPGVNAVALPGNEFLLGDVKTAFDDNGDLKDPKTANFLKTCLIKFTKFVTVINSLVDDKPLPPEDLTASGTTSTTIEGLDKTADDWYEQAVEKVNPASGDTYVKLDRGILTVDQINYFLKSMPMELTYADDNNQFLYYNQTTGAENMFAKRFPGQVGNPLIKCHPEKAYKNVSWVLSQLRSGKKDVIRVHVPNHGADKFVVHNYQALHDEYGAYKGVNEYILDFKPIVDFYLQQTGQKLVDDPDAKKADAVSSASVKKDSADTGSSASVKEETPDATSSASVNEEKPETPQADTGSSASVND